MVNYHSAPLDTTFAALADPTRRAILMRLAEGPASVNDLAEPFDMSLPAVSRHLKVLSKAGLLAQVRDGRLRHCHLVAKPMRDAGEWVANYRHFWETQLDALDRYLRSGNAPPEKS